jgi:O-antigen/teichoic acid export membrane protein
LSDLSTIDVDPVAKDADPVSQPEEPLFQKVVTRAFAYIPWLKDMPISPRIMTAMRGTTWTMIGYGSSQVLRLGSTLLLARMLAPQSFGLVALVNVFLGGLEMLTDLGIGLDVVQHKRGDDPKFINTAFCIQVVRGIGIWIIATAFARPFAHFYHQPAVVTLAMVASVSVLCRGFGGGSVWLLLRHVQLRQLTMLNLISEVSGFVVSVVWALISPTAWALVVGRVTSSVVFVIGSHLIPGHKTAFEWDRAAAKDILAFGTGIFLSSATYFMSGEAERLIMGKFVTVVELGCFSLALSMSGAASGAIQQVAGRVVFPMIATALRESNESAVRRYKKARLVFTALAIVVGVGAVAYGPRVVAILLSSKYFMTGWMLQLLGWRAAQDIFAAPTANVMLASGNSRVAAIANIARMTAMLSGLALAFTKYGIHMAIAVLAFSTLFGYFVYLYSLGKHLRGALWAEMSEFGIFVAATVAAAFIPWPWR